MSKEIPFREHHLINLLTEYEKQHLPLDLFISHYFRDHKALGAKDRGYIAETTYALIRWQGLIDYFEQPPYTWENRIQRFKTMDVTSFCKDETIPLHIRASFPSFLFNLIVKSYGEDKALELCLISNSPAPTTIRVNTLKTTREHLIQKWKECYSISPCQIAETAIQFHKKINFFTLPEFKEGLFEVQDEGSQLIGQLIKAKSGQHVLDYCSGSGGKTLAFAPSMEGKGQIYLHDVRSYALKEAQKRLKRAGIQNAQIVSEKDARLNKLKKKMDWVLVDVPCSGTGTMRRNPDMKWKFNEATLQRLIGQQRMIFEKGLSYLKPSGSIVYATCSILKEENEEQLEHFLKTYSLEIVEPVFKSIPSSGGMDGFFGVVLKKSESRK